LPFIGPNIHILSGLELMNGLVKPEVSRFTNLDLPCLALTLCLLPQFDYFYEVCMMISPDFWYFR
jgi:hypothetical protein